MSEPFLRGGRTHLVTGATSGIGRAVAQRLAARGDRLMLVVRSEDRVERLAAAIPSYWRIVVTDLADIEALADFDPLDGKPEVDRIDSVVHAAGVAELGPVETMDAGAWQRQLAVNLVAPALLTRAVLPALRAAGGTVVFVNSGAGLFAHPDWSAYAAAKHGLRALADALRAEEAPHGVRVTSVYPGRTATPMQEQVHAHEGREYAADDWIRPETVAAAILHAIDLPPDAVLTDLTLKPR